MKIGIFARTFGGETALETLSAARLAGYESVQYNMACSVGTPLPAEIGGETADAVASAAAATGIEIAAVSATYNMIHPCRRERERGRMAFAAIAAAARRMGTEVLTVCTGSRDPDDPWKYHAENGSAESWREMCGEFEILVGIAEEQRVVIGVEPELANVVNCAQRARELLDTFRTARIGIVFDAANLFETAGTARRKQLVESALDLLSGWIVLAHAKDRRADGSFTAAGHGVLDYRHYLAGLRRCGFRGSLIAHGLPAGDAARVAAFLKSEMRAVEPAQ